MEENAATAKTLEQQSGAMNESVGSFKLNGADGVAAIPSAPVVAMARPAKRAAAPARRARTEGALALADKEQADWKEF